MSVADSVRLNSCWDCVLHTTFSSDGLSARHTISLLIPSLLYTAWSIELDGSSSIFTDRAFLNRHFSSVFSNRYSVPLPAEHMNPLEYVSRLRTGVESTGGVAEGLRRIELIKKQMHVP